MNSRTIKLMFVLLALYAQPLFAQWPSVRWMLAYNLFNDRFYSVDAADSSHYMGMAQFMGYRNTIRRSTDGGLSWHQMYADSSSSITFFDITHPRPDLCLVSCDKGRALCSADSGITWQMVQIGPVSGYGSYVSMLPNGFGVYLTRPLDLALTSDGGVSWEERRLPDTLDKLDLSVTDIQPLSEKTIVAILTGGVNVKWMTRTDDGGKSWEIFPGPPHCLRMHFIDSLRGWAVGAILTGLGDQAWDVIERTTDGGRTWAEQLNVLIDPEFGLNAVEFADSLHGIAVGQVGKILRTSDGGEHWIQDQSGLDLREIPQIVGVAYPVKSLAIAVTNNGDVLRYRDTLPPLPAAVPLRAASGTDMQLVPNPVAAGSPATVVLRLAEAGEVELRSFDLLGHEVFPPERLMLDAGEHRLVLAVMPEPRSVSYVVRISFRGEIHTRLLRVE